MKSDILVKIAILCIIVAALFGPPLAAPGDDDLRQSAKNACKDEGGRIIEQPGISKYWDNFTFIHINGNWSDAVNNGYVKGSGTPFDPYRIENMTIDATASPTGCGIWIENSTATFIIRNCTIRGASNSGIFLNLTVNGTVSSCLLEDNNWGIKIADSNKTTIYNSVIKRSTESGIYLLNRFAISVNCSVKKNNITKCLYGIKTEIGYRSHFLNISDNNIFNCSENGIFLQNIENSTINNNKIEGCYKGSIKLEGTSICNNTIENNIMESGGIIFVSNLAGYTTHRISQSNLLNNKPVYYYVQETGLTNDNFSNAGQIMLYYCNDIKILNQNINNVYRAIGGEFITNMTVESCNFTEIRGQAIRIVIGENNTINNNNIRGIFEAGLDFASVDNSTIINNTVISFNTTALEIYRCEDFKVSGNHFTNCSIYFGATFISECKHKIDNSNTVNTKPIYYYFSAKRLKPSNFTDAGQIIICNVSDLVIKNVNISFGTEAITSFFSTNITIDEINASFCRYAGVRITRCGNHTIKNCFFKYNEEGIFILQGSSVYKRFNIINNTFLNNNNSDVYMSSAKYSKIISNNFSQNKNDAIFLYNVYNLTVYKNSFYGERRTIVGTSCGYINITENNFEKAKLFAIRLSGNNYSIISNNFINCTEDVILLSSEGSVIAKNNFTLTDGYSVYFNSDSKYCRIYLNNFKNGKNHYAYDDSTANKWHNGTIGNYWDDYGGKDADDDGIGDTPYDKIDGASNTDPYPIWWDAPKFNFKSPANGSLFDKNAPTITINITEGISDTVLYNITGSSGFYNFSPPAGQIDQNAWNNAPNGTIIIQFFINDSKNYISSEKLKLRLDKLGPIITITAPAPGTEYGKTAPNAANFSITIIDGNKINYTWYRLYNASYSTENRTWTGEIDQDLWERFNDGSITLIIYANDSFGNINNAHITLIKKIVPDQTESGSEKEKEEEQNISEIISNPITLITAAAIAAITISIIILGKKRKRYKSSKKEREKIDNILSKANFTKEGSFIRSIHDS
ncbi:MAG: NosD domain-containing protein [Promethearchaeota archaeon]